MLDSIGMEDRMVRPARRIVTASDEHGLSHVLIDAAATNVQGALTELWHTEGMPASNGGTRDNAAGWSGLEPPRGGALFGFFEVAPEAVEEGVPPAERERLWAERFAAIKAAHCRPDTRCHPAMHMTSTTDYIALPGRITRAGSRRGRAPAFRCRGPARRQSCLGQPQRPKRAADGGARRRREWRIGLSDRCRSGPAFL